MSILERLRKRSGLLVAIVGLALFAFVLTGLFERGSSLFGGSDRIVGEIAGKTIEYNTFNAKVQEAVENQKRNNGKTTLSQEETDQIVQQTWNQLINSEVLDKEYARLGIAISDEELYDLMVDHPHQALIRNLSDPKTGKVSEMFADPATGQVSPTKIKEFTSKMSDEQEKQWAQLETYIRQVRTIEKYNNLIKKGIYITSSAAKNSYISQNASVNAKFVMKDYKTIADSAIKYVDGDLEIYYNNHKNDYKQEASRKLEYVAFEINPSEEDMDIAKKNMQRIGEEFKTKTSKEDSAYVVAQSDSRTMDLNFYTKGTVSPQIESTVFDAELGTVIGPYMENGSIKVSKLTATKNSADSAKVRHILIAFKGSGASQTVTRNKVQAKSLADSLLPLLKKGAKFADFVEKYSDDSGKTKPANKKEGEDYTGKGGNYGWLNAKSGFVEPFKNAGLDNKKGDLVIVESNYGYHIIEVLDSKGSQKKVQVATIESKIEPSSKTMQAVFVKASEFSGKNTTNELFQKAVIDEKLNKRVADNIKESDKTIAGIESPRQLVRWAYEKNKGEVSEPMEFGNKFIVASLTDVREKGIAPLEQVKDDVVAKVIKEKKAEMLATEFTTALSGATSPEALAEKMKLSAMEVPNVNFNTTSLPNGSNESTVIGAITGLKAKTFSKPLTGKEGVYVVYALAVNDAPVVKDYRSQQSAGMSQLQGRVDYEVYDALKFNANIVDKIVKFY